MRVEGRPRAVRLTGSFLPLTPLLDADSWRLEQTLAVPAPSLGGERGPARLTGGLVLLRGATGAVDGARGPFHLRLATNVGAYHAIGASAISDGDVLRVPVDPHSLRHADERARP